MAGIEGKQALLVTYGAEDAEAVVVARRLEVDGINVTLAAAGHSVAHPANRYPLSTAQARLYDVVIFVGGLEVTPLWDDEDAIRLAREAEAQGKVLAALDHAPVILARAGVLTGRTAAVAPGLEREVQAGGGGATEQGIEVDQRLVTGRGPGDAEAFADAIAERLGG